MPFAVCRKRHALNSVILPLFFYSFHVILKVTMHLQGCLACKRCSVPGLNCSYLNPYIKSKLIGLAIRLYRKFWKKMNCRIFHDSLMRAPKSPFERSLSKRIHSMNKLGYFIVLQTNTIFGIALHFLKKKYHQEI